MATEKKGYPSYFTNSHNYKPHGNQLMFKIKSFVRKHLLVVLIITGALIGFIIGISINGAVQDLKQPGKYTAVIVIGFPGELLIRMLKMLILPLITCSLIVGLANLDSKVSGKIGGRAVIYYMSTTVMAAVLGLMLVSAIKPGSGMARPDEKKEQELVRPLDSFMDIVRNMFPSNIVKACVEQDKTVIKEEQQIVGTTETFFNAANFTQAQINQMVKDKKIRKLPGNFGTSTRYVKKVHEYETYKIGKGLITKGKANFLGVIVFAIAVGIIAGRMGREADAFVQFLSVFNRIITKLVTIVMWYSPVGIASLIAARFADMENIASTFSSLALFMVTVILGIAIHGLIVLPLIFFGITRKNPYRHLMGMTQAMVTAFGTDSSAATLPVTIRCLEEKLNIDKRITRFILPVGTTINMDGTALYEAVSAIFIAQTVGHSLSFGDYVAISFTSILASVGAAAIPHAGLVTMLIVLDTVGLPTDMIAVIFSIDWFLDRIRTMINVLGDAYGAGIVQHLSLKDLQAVEADEEETAIMHEAHENNIRNSRNEFSSSDGLSNHQENRKTTYL